MSVAGFDPATSDRRWVRHGRKLFFVAASFAGATAALSAPASAADGGLCVDSDGDGWGWDGNATCTDISPVDIPELAAASGGDDSWQDQQVADNFDAVADGLDAVADDLNAIGDDFDSVVDGLADGTFVEIPAAAKERVDDLVYRGSADTEYDLGTFTDSATVHYYHEKDDGTGLHSVTTIGGDIVDFGRVGPAESGLPSSDTGTDAPPIPGPQIFESIISQEDYQGVPMSVGEKVRRGQVLKAWQNYYNLDKSSDPDDHALTTMGVITSLQAYEVEARIAGNDSLADDAAAQIERLAREYENGPREAPTARQQLISENRSQVEDNRESMLRDGDLRRRPGQGGGGSNDRPKPETASTDQGVDTTNEQPQTDRGSGVGSRMRRFKENREKLQRQGLLPQTDDVAGAIAPISGDPFGNSFDWPSGDLSSGGFFDDYAAPTDNSFSRLSTNLDFLYDDFGSANLDYSGPSTDLAFSFEDLDSNDRDYSGPSTDLAFSFEDLDSNNLDFSAPSTDLSFAGSRSDSDYDDFGSGFSSPTETSDYVNETLAEFSPMDYFRM